METKQCTACLTHKDLKQFGLKKSSKNGLESRCKPCRAKIERTNKYNLSHEEIEQLTKQQQNCCAICNRPETNLNSQKTAIKSLAVDHCHETNKIRGLLCSNCNIGLGKFKDNIEFLRNAIKYLENNKTES